jgi:integrase
MPESFAACGRAVLETGRPLRRFQRDPAVASLYRPTIVEYRLPGGSYRTADGQRVTGKTPGAVRVVRQSRTWFGRYTDGAGQRHQVRLSESKETARRMLAKLAGDAQLAGVGIVDPYAEHRHRPLLEHLAEYSAYLAGKGDTAQHVAQTEAQCKAVLTGCRFVVAGDLQASAVVDFLATLRQPASSRPVLPAGQEWFTRAELVTFVGVHSASVARMIQGRGLTVRGQGRARRYHRDTVLALRERAGAGASVTTSNHYLTAIKGFTRWLARDRRIAADPLAFLVRQNPDVDVRRRRRALPEDEFSRFVEVTAAGAPFRGLSGADRLILYTLAANTGFRADELASLTPSSFHLAGDRPTVTVAAAYSKHRREDVQQLRGDVAAMMRSYLDGRPRRQPVWPGTWHERAAEMIRKDLAAAGIPFQDDDGRRFDFHAMRGQFISLLAAKGVHPKVAQTLARHSTITLTMDYYTHLDVFDVAGALEKLPELPGTSDEGKDRGQG